MTEHGRCPRCGTPTRSVTVEDRKGRTVAELMLDTAPHPSGDVLITHGRGSRLRPPALEAARHGRLELYRPHLATCPAMPDAVRHPTLASSAAAPEPEEEADPWTQRRDLDL